MRDAPSPRPLSRAEYDRMVEHGVFQDERIELLRGVLVKMSPQGAWHADLVTQIVEMLQSALRGRASVRPQCPLAVSDHSEPEPDIAVVPRRRYRGAHPTAAHLVIEVADSSRPKDRGIKAELYAGCGIAEYWIVDVIEQVIEVRTNPEQGIYRTVTMKQRGDVITLVEFPEVQIAVHEIW